MRRSRPAATAPASAEVAAVRRLARDARATCRRKRASSRARALNKPGSEKDTWHVGFDLADSGLDYRVGDSFGVFPVNDPAWSSR
jgi:sulfite reductase (NADPH) flavoprotein alpha-component